MAQKFDLDRLKRLTSAEGMKGFDEFVDAMPQRLSQSLLIIAGVVWALVGVAIVFANIKTEDIANLRSEVLKTEAVRPNVPNISETPVSTAEIRTKIATTQDVYENINFTISDGRIEISTNDNKQYGPFIQTIYSIMSLGSGYKITLNSYCEGANCQESGNRAFLSATFNVNKLEVQSNES